MKSVCKNSDCPNKDRIANHPRSDTPKVCGICGDKCRFIGVQKDDIISSGRFNDYGGMEEHEGYISSGRFGI